MHMYMQIPITTIAHRLSLIVYMIDGISIALLCLGNVHSHKPIHCSVRSTLVSVLHSLPQTLQCSWTMKNRFFTAKTQYRNIFTTKLFY